MVQIIRIESKRILNKRVFWLFFSIVTLFSVCSTYVSLRRFMVPGMDGTAVTWQENLAHVRKSPQGRTIDRELLVSMRQKENLIYGDENSLDEIVRLNYEGKSVQELTDEEIDRFYARRLWNIRAILAESRGISYTQEEIERFMQKEAEVSEIQFGYAEGWKVLNHDMEIFAALLLILISVLLLPLFGNDSQSDMKELYRAAKFGKNQLDWARGKTALIVGIFLYVAGMILLFVIKMIPFGLEGWNQSIQSNPGTFFSLYHITNLQQFLLNILGGLVALLFVISLTLFLTVFMGKALPSAVVAAFFWILLLLFDQLYLWPVNHYFANFMPLRMVSFSHYYIGNERYRIFGISLPCMIWSLVLSGMLAGMMLVLAVWGNRIKLGVQEFFDHHLTMNLKS